jgi:hypothetical protein
MLLSGFVAASNTNVIAGSIFEFIKRPTRIDVAVAEFTVALNAGNLFSFQIGDQVIAQNAQVFSYALTTSGATDRLRFPDDFFIQQEPALPGDRLILSITRAAGNICWVVRLTEVS